MYLNKDIFKNFKSILLFLYVKSLSGKFKFFLVCFLSQLIIYSPYLLKINVQNDDFNYFVPEENSSNTHPQFRFFILLGRPLSAIILSIQNLLISNINSLIPMRIFTIFLISYAGVMIQIWLVRYLNKIFSYLLSISLIFLPGFSFFVNLTVAFSYVIPVILSIYLVQQQWASPKSTQLLNLSKIFNKKNIFLFFLSISLYQPTAMFFIPLMLLPILKSGVNELKDHLVRVFFLLLNFFVASLSYLILIKFLAIAYLEQLWVDEARILYSINNGMYKIDFTSDLITKTKELFDEVLPYSLNFWSIYKTNYFLFLLIFLIFSLLILFFIGDYTIDFKLFSFKMFSILAALFFSVLPNLLANGGYIAYRTLLVLQVCLVLIFAFLINELFSYCKPIIRKIVIILGLANLIFALTLSYCNSYTTALNNELQLIKFRDSLSRLPNGLIEVQGAVPNLSYTGLPPVNDEFNFNSSAYYLMIPLATSDTRFGPSLGYYRFKFPENNASSFSNLNLFSSNFIKDNKVVILIKFLREFLF